MQNLIATTFEVVHYIALQAVHYKPLQEVHLSRYNHIAGGGLPAGMEATAAYAASRGKTKGVPTGENWMSIELRTVAGTDMRIQGGLTPCDGAHNPQKRIGHVLSWRRSEVLALHEADGHAQELQHAERDSEQRHASEPVRRGCLRVR